MDGSQGELFASDPSPDGASSAPTLIRPARPALDASAVRAFLTQNPAVVRDDPELLETLGLKPAEDNVVAFVPAALARVSAAHQREAEQRREIEETARANFAAQAQIHGAVVDLLDARNLSDLASRVDLLAQSRFGLTAAVIALETDGYAPAGWRQLVPGQVDLLLDGQARSARMGFAPTALGLFAPDAEIRTMAMVRLSLGAPARQGLLAFGSTDPDAFTPDMGSELVEFLARVVERTAERWPLL